MSQPFLMTYHDALQHARTFSGEGTAGGPNRRMYQAVQSAYRDVGQCRNWSYFREQKQIRTNAAYSTGTIAYDHTGGTYERQVTLTTGTWPSWALYGRIIISDVSYPIEDRKSDSIVTLREDANPGADVDSGTSYQLVRRVYPLPADFRRTWEPQPETSHMQWMDFEEMVAREVHSSAASGGTPCYYTIGPDPNLHGQMGLYVWPAASTSQTIDLPYIRRGRQMTISGEDTKDRQGTLTTDGTASITGNSTSFQSRHEGCIVRGYWDNTQYPTGLDGPFPFAFQRTILSVDSTTGITVDATVEALTNVKYVISDPVTIEQTMATLLLRAIEYNVALVCNWEGRERAAVRDAWKEAKGEAQAEDERTMPGVMYCQPLGGGGYRRGRFLKGQDNE